MDEDELRELMGDSTPEPRAAESKVALLAGNYRKYVTLTHGRDRRAPFQEVEGRSDDATTGRSARRYT